MSSGLRSRGGRRQTSNIESLKENAYHGFRLFLILPYEANSQCENVKIYAWYWQIYMEKKGNNNNAQSEDVLYVSQKWRQVYTASIKYLKEVRRIPGVIVNKSDNIWSMVNSNSKEYIRCERFLLLRHMEIKVQPDWVLKRKHGLHDRITSFWICCYDSNFDS